MIPTKDEKIVDPLAEYEVRSEDQVVSYDDDPNETRSKFVAFLMGGVVIAGGLLAFLYYDSNNFNPDYPLTTGSIGRSEAPSSVIVPSKPVVPAAPDTTINK